jgi:peptidoglycan/LPS O-acetylase OafA/YrhL
VAVIAVVAYHSHIGLFRGGYVGVDVFFVISGFLITSLLWREIEGTGRLSVGGFYGRRVRRLLPAATVVTVLTLWATERWVPPLQAASVWKDGLASALYVGNYRFAWIQTNYLATSTPPSPFQHYWSLGVEEQFYLLWPLLLVSVALWARGRRSPRLIVAATVGALTVVSFESSLVLTRRNEPWAFFSLPTRAWELGAGALVALAWPWVVRLPTQIGLSLGWFGLLAVAASVVAFSASTPFPGTAALIPVLGTAAVLVAGGMRAEGGPVLVLGRRPMRFGGRISYSLYLWHWPVIILAPYVVGHALNTAEYVALIPLSVLLATATFLLVERPVRDWGPLAASPRRSLRLGAGLTAGAVAAVALVAATLPSTAGHGQAPVAVVRPEPTAPAAAPPATGSPNASPIPSNGSAAEVAPLPNPSIGAAANAETQVHDAVTSSAAANQVPANLDPSLASARSSESAPTVDGCLLSYLATTNPPCLFGDRSAPRSIVLFGDSHATMWFPAVNSYALAQADRMYVWTKATCPPVEISLFSPVLGREFSECDRWRAATLARITALRPSLVVLGIAPNYDAAYQVTQDGPRWLDGLAATVRTLRSAGSEVVVLGPVPSPPEVVANCLSAHLTSATSCAVPLHEALPGGAVVGYDAAGLASEAATVASAGGFFVNVIPWFCAASNCPAIVDNLLVYRDNSHVTVPYSTYLAPLVTDELALAAQGCSSRSWSATAVQCPEPLGRT